MKKIVVGLLLLALGPNCHAFFGMYFFDRTETYTEWTLSKNKADESVRIGDAVVGNGVMEVQLECASVEYSALWSVDIYKNPGLGIQRRNEKVIDPATGKRRRKIDCAFSQVDVELTGLGVDGREIDTPVKKRVPFSYGTARIALKEFAQELSQQPDTLRVLLTASAYQTVRADVTVTQAQVADMGLNTDRWLPPDVLKDLLMARILKALKSKEYAAALPAFKEMEKQNSDLPESFYYYYIEALSGMGEKASARVRMDAYVRKYGKSGKYYAKVLELMTQ